MITHSEKLNMTPGGIPVVIHLSQYDDDFSLVFDLYTTDGTFSIQSGTTAEIRGTKTDGNGYSVDATIDINNSRVTVAGDKQMTASAGSNIFELKLVKDEKELNTANFIIEVERAALDRGTIPSQSKIMELYDVLDRVDEIESAAEAVEDSVVQIAKNTNDIHSLKDASTKTENRIIQTAGVVEELQCGLTDAVKTALLNCFSKVAWIDGDGRDYYDALSSALNSSRNLTGIRAVFAQGSSTIYDTDELYALKQYLTVTATYSDGTTREISNYTLEGTLTAGTSTITVAYNKKTTTFNVAVTHQTKTIESIQAVFDSSATITTNNNLDDLRPYLTVRALYNDGTSGTITNYTLSGSLNEGQNTITVEYGGKTTTFTVTVTTPVINLQSISATFAQGSAVIYTNSSLNDLKQYLTVTAKYSDGTTQNVTDYALNGTLVAGTSTITASYGGKTDTFNVVVTERAEILQSISATFNQGSTVIYSGSDLSSLRPYLTVTANYSDGTSQIVTAYDLTGTLTAGTSIITVSYGGKTDTFNVTVTQSSRTLDSITATFDPGTNKIYEATGLEGLKLYLTVTAHYSDGTSQTVTSYQLAGNLKAGQTCSIQVTYVEDYAQSCSFTVNVEALLYEWDFTKSLYDKVANVYATPSSDGTNAPPSQTSNGVVFDAPTQVLTFISANEQLDHLDMTLEIDVSSFDFKGDTTHHIRFLMDQLNDTANGVGLGALIFQSEHGWSAYGYTNPDRTSKKWATYGWGDLYSTTQINAFSGKTVKVYYGADGHTRKLYLDGTLVGSMVDVYFSTADSPRRLRLGGGMSHLQSSGDQCYDMTVTGIRIYRGEV